MDYEPLECWAFAWINSSPSPYITRITGYTRRDCMQAVIGNFGMPWRKIYRCGGRLVKCIIVQAV